MDDLEKSSTLSFRLPYPPIRLHTNTTSRSTRYLPPWQSAGDTTPRRLEHLRTRTEFRILHGKHAPGTCRIHRFAMSRRRTLRILSRLCPQRYAIRCGIDENAESDYPIMGKIKERIIGKRKDDAPLMFRIPSWRHSIGIDVPSNKRAAFHAWRSPKRRFYRTPCTEGKGNSRRTVDIPRATSHGSSERSRKKRR